MEEQRFGHLGCVLETGEPYVVPVNYLLEDDGIYIHTLPGQKLDALRANGKVCLQVEKIEDSFRWQSVIVFGEFEEIKRTNRTTEILKNFSARFEQLTPVESMVEEKSNRGKLIVFRIAIKRITGITES